MIAKRAASRTKQWSLPHKPRGSKRLPTDHHASRFCSPKKMAEARGHAPQRHAKETDDRMYRIYRMNSVLARRRSAVVSIESSNLLHPVHPVRPVEKSARAAPGPPSSLFSSPYCARLASRARKGRSPTSWHSEKATFGRHRARTARRSLQVRRSRAGRRRLQSLPPAQRRPGRLQRMTKNLPQPT